jgi:hypothetical protein
MSKAFLWAILPLCACAGPSKDASEFRDRLLGEIPPDARIDVPVVFSADGRKAAWVERREGSSRVIFGSWTSRTYGIVC